MAYLPKKAEKLIRGDVWFKKIKRVEKFNAALFEF
jgi:hypothetical protein